MSKMKKWVEKHQKSITLAIGIALLLGVFILVDLKEERNPSFVESESDKKVAVGGSEEVDPEENSSGEVVVHVAGAVKHPGVYTLDGKARVHMAVEEAEPLNEADLDALNLAARLTDGEKIIVPKKGEHTQADHVNTAAGESEAAKININTADKEMLMQLSGIGEKRAEDIIKYRESNGGFAKIEDLQEVSGIGEKTFENLKDGITV